MANRKCICDRCGRPNKFRGICAACARAIAEQVDRFVEEVPASWKPFIVKRAS